MVDSTTPGLKGRSRGARRRRAERREGGGGGGCWQPARERDETTSTRERGAVPVGESVTAMLEGEETRVIFRLES